MAEVRLKVGGDSGQITVIVCNCGEVHRVQERGLALMDRGWTPRCMKCGAELPLREKGDTPDA